MEGTPKQLTPEEIAKLEKSRTISDANFLEKGAEYVVDDNGNKHLRITDEQLEGLNKEEARKKIKATEEKYGAEMAGTETIEQFQSKMELIMSLKEKDLVSYVKRGERHRGVFLARIIKVNLSHKNPSVACIVYTEYGGHGADYFTERNLYIPDIISIRKGVNFEEESN